MSGRHTARVLWILLALSLMPAARVQGQGGGLGTAVERARGAWIRHDVAALLSGSDTVRLRLRHIARSESVRPGQAARLLDRYLARAEEVSFVLHQIRRLAEDHAYAEMVRRYIVEGTSEERKETVYLGFRLLDGGWRLREVRVTP